MITEGPTRPQDALHEVFPSEGLSWWTPGLLCLIIYGVNGRSGHHTHRRNHFDPPIPQTCPPPPCSSSSPSLLYRIAKIYFIATFSPVIIPYYVTKTSLNVVHIMVTAAQAEKEEG